MHTHTHARTHADTHTGVLHLLECVFVWLAWSEFVVFECLVDRIGQYDLNDIFTVHDIYVISGLQMASSSMSYHWLKACQQVMGPLFRFYSHLFWYRMRPISLTCLPMFVRVYCITLKTTYVRPMGSTLLFCMRALRWNVPWCMSNVKLLIDTMSNVWMETVY